MAPRSQSTPTIADIGAASLRDDPGEASLDETKWAVGRLSVVGLERLSTFLVDLANRAPFDGPAWAPHKLVLESLEADIRRERESRNGTPDSSGKVHIGRSDANGSV